jgi:hypothetical protein
MQYRCDDIERILASSLDAAYDHDAFMAHIESCESCRKLGTLETGAENAFDSLLPSSAPESIAVNVMKAVKLEAKIASPTAIANRIRLALLGAIYLIIIALTMANQKIIISGMVKAADELNRIWGFSSSLGITRESVVSYLNKAALSPVLLTALMGLAIIIWTFSVLRFRETN